MPGAQLAPGQVVETTWRDEDLLLYRTQTGECVAITAYCPHMNNYMPNGLAPGTPLAALLVHDELCCPYHGWRFNGEGRCTHIPQGQRVPPAVSRGRAVARSWPVREQGRYIQIGLAENY
jgi:3-ketosteroid 9alpha-monooxygenase subunit A